MLARHWCPVWVGAQPQARVADGCVGTSLGSDIVLTHIRNTEIIGFQIVEGKAGREGVLRQDNRQGPPGTGGSESVIKKGIGEQHSAATRREGREMMGPTLAFSVLTLLSSALIGMGAEDT